MDSLKRSCAGTEEVYVARVRPGYLSYRRAGERYSIWATLENKALIFQLSCVLAHADYCDRSGVPSGSKRWSPHEYFPITGQATRDLVVTAFPAVAQAKALRLLRDSASLRRHELGKSVNRIEGVTFLARQPRFAEDCRPPWPTRSVPDSFYRRFSTSITLTVLRERRQRLVRHCLHHGFLGAGLFAKGTEPVFFDRHDGQAGDLWMTLSRRLEECNGATLPNFKRWYSPGRQPRVLAVEGAL